MLYQLRNKKTNEFSTIGRNSRTRKELFNHFLNSLDFDDFNYKELFKIKTSKIKRLISLQGFEIITIKKIK